MTGGSGFADKVQVLVQRIPEGRVMSYGQIARCLGHPNAARQVGYAMARCAEGIPWHRVVNAKGRISQRADSDAAHWQRLLLEAEGVVFDPSGRVDFCRFGWDPGSPQL